jgi:hypothetical protein
MVGAGAAVFMTKIGHSDAPLQYVPVPVLMRSLIHTTAVFQLISSHKLLRFLIQSRDAWVQDRQS